MIYDLIIVGGGPAGVAAGVYAARKRLTTLFITTDFGGQSVVSSDVQNWIGTPHISGSALAASFKAHLNEYAGDSLTIKNARAEKVTKTERGVLLTTTGNETFEATTLLVATGADRRKLTVPGAAAFEHKGLTYCASCDGPLFSGSDVVVIGGGNAGFETALQLLAYAKSVTLLDRADSFKAEPITVEKALKDPKMSARKNIEVTEVMGEKMVTGLKVMDHATGKEEVLQASGVFVEIGIEPNTKLVEGVVDMDAFGRIKVDPLTKQSSVIGIWAAGDCINALYHQNNIAAGDGVTAIEDIYLYLKTR